MKNRPAKILTLLITLMAIAGSASAGWEEGVAAFKSGNFEEAAKQFQAFVDERPDVFQGHLMLGQALAKLNRNQDAIAHLRKATELNPGDVGTNLALGKVYLDAGRSQDAAAILGKIDASSLPAAQQPLLYQMLAKALENSGDVDSAVQQLARAAKAKPNDADLQFQYGSAALRADDLNTALTALGKAASLAPSDPDKQYTYAQALLRKGRTSTGQAKTQAYQQASSAASKLVAASATYDNLMLLAGAQLGAKQYDNALSTLQQAARKNPSDWLPLFYQGQAYTQKDQLKTAESSLKQALDKAQSRQDQVTVWKQLGFVYERQKSYDAAKNAYQKAGDSAAVTRVEENQRTAEYNQAVEEENRIIRELAEEEAKIKEQLEELPGGPPPAD